MALQKLTQLSGEPVTYGDCFNTIGGEGWTAIEATTAGSPLDLFLTIARQWEQPFALLFVLVASRNDEWPDGRYQSDLFEGFADVEVLLEAHREFLEQDGRHEIWLFSAAENRQVIWSHHDIFTVYGDDDVRGLLQSKGFKEGGAMELPAPHAHHFHAEFDGAFQSLMNSIAWHRTDLQDGDGERR